MKLHKMQNEVIEISMNDGKSYNGKGLKVNVKKDKGFFVEKTIAMA